jgi:uncharacterized protein (DUF2249 family)
VTAVTASRPAARAGWAAKERMNVAEAKLTLDVRTIVPAQRHARIHAEFDALRSGEAMILVNDHDPRPLYYELSAEKPGTFEWTYLERGPAVWRILLQRR